jgi:hypothetical protein
VVAYQGQGVVTVGMEPKAAPIPALDVGTGSGRQAWGNGAHDYVPGVEPYAHVQLQATGAAHLLRVGAHRRLHGQGRVAGAQGMVFVGQGGAQTGP